MRAEGLIVSKDENFNIKGVPYHVMFISDRCTSLLNLVKTAYQCHGELCYRYCIPEEDCSSDTNVTVDNLALLNSFVEAAKKDRTVGTSIFAGWRMTYDDLNGLYTGLLAGAVSSCALALTAVVGLAITYILDYWG